MFLGSYRHAVDAKGRVAVPADYRKELPRSGAVISVGLEGRLVIHPPEEWQRVMDRYRLTTETPEDERRYGRTLMANARPVELDGQGRLLLDPGHRRWAQITDRAFFTGFGSVIEIVGEEVWDREQGDLDPATFTELHDRISTRAVPATVA